MEMQIDKPFRIQQTFALIFQMRHILFIFHDNA